MTTDIIIIVIILTFIIGIRLGYWYCMMRNRVTDMFTIIDILTDYMNGTITIEIANEKINKIVE